MPGTYSVESMKVRIFLATIVFSVVALSSYLASAPEASAAPSYCATLPTLYTAQQRVVHQPTAYKFLSRAQKAEVRRNRNAYEYAVARTLAAMASAPSTTGSLRLQKLFFRYFLGSAALDFSEADRIWMESTIELECGYYPWSM